MMLACRDQQALLEGRYPHIKWWDHVAYLEQQEGRGLMLPRPGTKKSPGRILLRWLDPHGKTLVGEIHFSPRVIARVASGGAYIQLLLGR
jgi:hypothetical protein